jgi:hypothetical protein
MGKLPKKLSLILASVGGHGVVEPRGRIWYLCEVKTSQARRDELTFRRHWTEYSRGMAQILRGGLATRRWQLPIPFSQ